MDIWLFKKMEKLGWNSSEKSMKNNGMRKNIIDTTVVVDYN